MKNETNNEKTESIQNDSLEQKSKSENQEAIEEFFKQKATKNKRKKRKPPKKKKSPQGILTNVFDSLKNTNSKDIYQELCKQKFIRSGSEFITNINENQEVK